MDDELFNVCRIYVNLVYVEEDEMLKLHKLHVIIMTGDQMRIKCRRKCDKESF